MLSYFSSMCESNPDLHKHISQQTQTGHEQLISGSSWSRDSRPTGIWSLLSDNDFLYNQTPISWYMVDFDLDPVLKHKCVLWICMKNIFLKVLSYECTCCLCIFSADVAHQFQYAVRVIGSNYAPTIERDEFLVSEKIKKERE